MRERRKGRAKRRAALLAGLLALILWGALPLALGQLLAPLGPWAEEASEAGPAEGSQSALGAPRDADTWREIRGGLSGTTSLPDKQAGLLIQSEGQNWRAIRNGPVTFYGAWLLLGLVTALALFFALRGPVRTEARPSGRRVARFNGFERGVHWFTATNFVLLALTGLVMLYGRHLILPLLGQEDFAALARLGKTTHNILGFAFAAGLIPLFVMWVRRNLPKRHDLLWLVKGGGLLTRASHPPAEKFNAGQKIVFWSVAGSGAVLVATGISLIFPFAWLDIYGMQVAHVIHAVVALLMTALIIAHIYIGTLGMEGAFDAMYRGSVDETFAREHHGLWLAELERSAPTGAVGEAAGGGNPGGARRRALPPKPREKKG